MRIKENARRISATDIHYNNSIAGMITIPAGNRANTVGPYDIVRKNFRGRSAIARKAAASGIFSRKMPYPAVGSFTRIWVYG